MEQPLPEPMSRRSAGDAWPYCPSIGGTCLVHDIGQRLGEPALSVLIAFVAESQEGARMTLQRTKDGFSLQVMGPVQRTRGTAVSLTQARALRQRMNGAGRAAHPE